MSSNNNTTSANSGGIGFSSLLTIVFIILKLLHKIDWSWIWVLSPMWISAGFALVVFALVVIVALVFGRD